MAAAHWLFGGPIFVGFRSTMGMSARRVFDRKRLIDTVFAPSRRMYP
jgi:hypothetical protein